MSAATRRAIDWVENGYVPDSVLRLSIRRLLKTRLDGLPLDDCERRVAAERAFIADMDRGRVAPVPDAANAQHYELPADFFSTVLGPHLKYSCAYWAGGVDSLADAETAALAATCERAGLADGMRILELGCGWGSLTLWMAERYPGATIVAVSNSALQRAFIEQRATERGLSNLQIETCDMNAFDTQVRFDRVVSIEMFEHMRNYRVLFDRIASWLVPRGQFFMHIFCHRSCPYEFVDRGESDWMSRHFFTGGIMPGDTLPLQFQDRLALVNQWRWNGTHYERTANAWLTNMDAARSSIMPVLEDAYGDDAARWWMRWRMFFMACAELFGYDAGEQWYVSHYLFEKKPADPAR